MWILAIIDTINKWIDAFLSAIRLMKKGSDASISQTIDNRKKESLIDIQFGGKRIYHIYEKYNPPIKQNAPLKDSTDTTTSILLESDDEEIEEAVNQYIQSQIDNEKDKGAV